MFSRKSRRVVGGAGGLMLALVWTYIASMTYNDVHLTREAFSDAVARLHLSGPVLAYAVHLLVMAALFPLDNGFPRPVFEVLSVTSTMLTIYSGVSNWDRKVSEAAPEMVARRLVMCAIAIFSAACNGMWLYGESKSPWTIMRGTSGFCNGVLMTCYAVFIACYEATHGQICVPHDAAEVGGNYSSMIHMPAHEFGIKVVASPAFHHEAQRGCMPLGRPKPFGEGVCLMLMALMATPKNRLALSHGVSSLSQRLEATFLRLGAR